MRLKTFRITGCFGFIDSGEVDLDPSGGITFLLGRNSSGKTSFLQALRHLEVDQVPTEYKNFANFNPVENIRAFIVGRFAVEADDFLDINPSEYVAGLIKKAGVSDEAVKESPEIQALLKTIFQAYSLLFDSLSKAGQVWVHKNSEGSYFFLSSPNDTSYEERKRQINIRLQGAFPGQKFKKDRVEVSVGITAQQIEDHLFNHFPPIIVFGSSYSLTENLPDRITTETLIVKNQNQLTVLFIKLLGRESVQRFLTANDPDERDSILSKLREHAAAFSDRINKDVLPTQITPGLVSLVLHEKEGLQVTVKIDEKKAFYRHLSENTKMLIAYHLHMMVQDIAGNILLFDEPSTGFHPSAQGYLLEFLQSLANAGNQVVISTHSEYMIDLDALAGVRLMKSDERGALLVANHPYRRTKSNGDMLALQPILDAIGLRYGMGLVLGRNVVLTEGVTDLLYLRAFNRLFEGEESLSISPGRGDSSLYTLVAFLIGQGAGIKLIIDSGGLKVDIQKAYGIQEDAIFEVPVPDPFRSKFRASGIEDLFSKADFYEVATKFRVDLGDRQTFDKTPNSHIMRKHPKRIVAHEFLASVGVHTWRFDDETRGNFARALQFCCNPNWFKL